MGYGFLLRIRIDNGVSFPCTDPDLTKTHSSRNAPDVPRGRRMNTTDVHDIKILGAGISGLTAAINLASSTM
jgi:hypothetical protein